ncbi:MAG TPA: DUF58 domain-containing protein [Candidatus Limnocylindria bacterium]|nr:DUF58 domain-containing protein [Candidatus Limnocylindria bacterium]
MRAIDWNVTARMGAPYVRRYHEDREVTAQFVCDLSPSVDFGTQTRTKRALVAEVVGVLSRILTRSGNRVGAVVFDGVGQRVVPAGSGRLQVLRILEELSRTPHRRRAPFTPLGDVLAAAAGALKRRSVVFVVSDFLAAPGWERPLGALALRHDVIALRVRDPREHELPDVGWVVLDDAETGEQLLVDTHDGSFRERFRSVIARHEERLRAAFARAGVDVMTLETEGDLVRDIVRFASLRRARRARRN